LGSNVRKLLLFALPFALGTGLCQYVLPEAWQTFGASAALLVGLALACLWKDRRRACAIATFGLAAGMLWFWCYGQLWLAPAEALVGTSEPVRMEVLDYAQKQDYGTRTTVRVLSRELRGRAIYYGDDEMLALEPGDRICVTVKYYSATRISGEESTYYTSQGIFSRLYGEGEVAVEQGRAGSLRYMPQRLVARLRESVEQIFDGQVAAFVTALLTGERHGLDEQSLADLQAAGLMHITAVSGLHCSFLIGLIGLLVGRHQKLTALLGYPVLLGYMLMVGCTPSVVRSCVMVGFLLLAPLVGREGDSPTSLGAAAVVILLVNPFAVASVSFQMSFGAVAGMLVVTPRLYGGLGDRKEHRKGLLGMVRRFVVSSLCVSFGVMAFTVPISAVYFGYISLVSFLSNLLVLWVAPALFGCALLTVCAAILLPGAAALAPATELMAGYVLKTAALMADIPGGVLRFATAAMALWLLYLYAMVLVGWLCRVRWQTWGLVFVLAGVTLAAVRSLPAASVRGGEMTVVAVDVGQGAATLIHSNGHTALVDCGSHYVSGGPGARVAEVMDTYGWKKLDRVVLTHYHEDHAGGLAQLLAQVDVEELMIPQLLDSADQAWLQQEVEALARRYDVHTDYVEEETWVPLGEGGLRVYPPLTRGETNEEGLTVLAAAGDFEVLMTGDMNTGTEMLLMERYALPDIEVLMVGHHGSRYSTSPELLQEVRPEVAVISVGENVYGHPTEEVLDRLERAGTQLYRTDRNGDVTIRVNRTGKE